MLNKLIEQLKDKNIAILGFSKEGKSTYNFIKRHNINSTITILDGNESLLENNPFLKEEKIELVLGEHYLDNLERFDLIFKSPGVKLKDIDITSFKDKITSNLGIVLDNYRDNLICITGTKGKSTTTSLIYKVLKDQNYDVYLTGNIGIPLLDKIDNIKENTIYVFEASSHQLEFVKTSPHIALILNLFEEHLDFYKSKNDYFLAKMNNFKYQTKDDYAIYTSSNETLNEYVKNGNYTSNLIDVNKKIIKKRNKLYINGKKVYNTKDKRLLLGEHNLKDIEFVLVLAEILKLDNKKLVESINTFKPLEHRLELVKTINKVTYYNDAISTIPQTTISAVKTLKKVDTLIFGGMDRGINYNELIEFLNNSRIRNFICMPTTGYNIGKKLKKGNIYYIEDLKDAVALAKKITKKGKICLLSPAASSYEYFKNFEEKGTKYKEYVLEENN